MQVFLRYKIHSKNIYPCMQAWGACRGGHGGGLKLARRLRRGGDQKSVGF